MARLVMKFGGTSVADINRIKNAAKHVRREISNGNHVVVVVSAMSGKTNELVKLTREAASLHDGREYDTVVSAGEQITSGLFAITLQSMGIDARSWQGWQIPVKTDDMHTTARITDIDSQQLIERLEMGQTAVVSGFQGVSPGNRIATLGRGGSDTSAVAVAAAIGADRCDIYTDVDGIYTTDPRIETKARRLDRISYEEMLEFASLGAKVLQVRSVELAMIYGVRTFVRSSFDSHDNLVIQGANNLSGTLICNEEYILEKQVVTGVAYTKDEAQVSLRHVPDKPGTSASIFTPLARENINVDMIVQSVSQDDNCTNMTFTVPETDLDRAINVLNQEKDNIGFVSMQSNGGLVKISVIGIGMRSHAGVASTAFTALAEKGINIRAITTSEIKFSVLIDAEYLELAVRTLHCVYKLDI